MAHGVLLFISSPQEYLLELWTELTCKFLAIDTFPPCSIMVGEVASLAHKSRNDPVENGVGNLAKKKGRDVSLCQCVSVSVCVACVCVCVCFSVCVSTYIYPCFSLSVSLCHCMSVCVSCRCISLSICSLAFHSSRQTHIQSLFRQCTEHGNSLQFWGPRQNGAAAMNEKK
jgi:hypothetical protein